MKYITLKTSETGKKLAEVERKIDEAFEAQKTMATKYGFTQWRSGCLVVAGRISSVMFPKNHVVDTAVWRKNGKDEWMPRGNTKAGKAIQSEFDQMPRVTPRDLNSCVGFSEPLFERIGFAFNNELYYGFELADDWKANIPDDCEEITVTRYRELFLDKKEKVIA